VQSEEDLTDSQWFWLQCQCLLDDGVLVCPACAALGTGTYCQSCGRRLAPVTRPCDQCHVEGSGAYCAHCGAALQSAVTEAIDAGTFDWDAWARSLRPFLGGLTPQEQRLLAQERG